MRADVLKAMCFLAAAIGYGIIINVAKPTLFGWLGDSTVERTIHGILVLVPLIALTVGFMKAMGSRQRSSEAYKHAKSTDPNIALWTGKLSLIKSFWFGYIPYAFFAGLSGNFIVSVHWDATDHSKWVIAAFIMIMAMVALAMRGVWRSGNQYEGKHMWVILSRVAMLLGVPILYFTIST